MQVAIARKIATSYCYKMQPHCKDQRVRIAGSTRRESKEVKDIEIVVLPKEEILRNMFGWDEGVIRSVEFIQTVNSFGKIIKGNANGKMMQIELPEGIMLDLFIPSEDDYFRQFAIRTGSADYSFKVIANGWKKCGWCGSDQGLRKMIDCIEIKLPDGKSKWKCINKKGEKPPVWQSEEEFFNWIKVPFIHPSKRYI